MTYEARALTEDGEILCCCTLCEADGGCLDYGKCKAVKVVIEDKEQEMEVAI